jgi:hypothetical protein
MSNIVSAKTQTGHDLPGYITPDGQIRLLASLPGPRSIRVMPFAKENRVIPQEEWFEFERHRSDVPIKDQQQEGSCVANGWISMLERSLSAAGQAHRDLSRAMLYAFINGGRDAGANPSDAAEVVSTLGVCTEETVPYRFLVERQIPQAARDEAKRFAVPPDAIYAINSWDELVSAEILGYKTGMTVLVAGNYIQLDGDGCPPVHRGVGNHWQSCDSRLKKTSRGDWVLGAIQSWGLGVWNNGLGFFRESHWDSQPGVQGYAIRYPGQDPLDPNLVPPAA